MKKKNSIKNQYLQIDRSPGFCYYRPGVFGSDLKKARRMTLEQAEKGKKHFAAIGIETTVKPVENDSKKNTV